MGRSGLNPASIDNEPSRGCRMRKCNGLHFLTPLVAWAPSALSSTNKKLQPLITELPLARLNINNELICFKEHKKKYISNWILKNSYKKKGKNLRMPFFYDLLTFHLVASIIFKGDVIHTHFYLSNTSFNLWSSDILHWKNINEQKINKSVWEVKMSEYHYPFGFCGGELEPTHHAYSKHHFVTQIDALKDGKDLHTLIRMSLAF